jgi:crotonobetainyl-CoA:carnitine CoA-transferase CaiB-like acyl-CoA transferase
LALVGQDADFPHGPVRSVAEAFEDEQVSHREMVQTREHPSAGQIRLVGPAVKLSRTPAKIQSPPPLIGEHTDAVLKRLLQLSDEQIQALRREQVIA